jgi:branched-subunit amino acid ABC-type transport system permease component
LGAYFALSVLGQQGAFNIAARPTVILFLGALIVAGLGVAVVGMVLELPMRRTYGKKPLYGLLLTFGASYVFEEIIRQTYGTEEMRMKVPELFTGSFQVGALGFSQYRLVTSLIALVLIIGLWLIIEKTRLGAIIKAGAYDSEMVMALGINLKTLRMLVFGLGAMLAAFAGVILAPVWGVRPHMGMDAVLPAFLIVALGGVGSFWGTVIGALMIGEAVGITGAYASDWSVVSMYVTLVLVLAVRRRGLFGKRSALDE